MRREDSSELIKTQPLQNKEPVQSFKGVRFFIELGKLIEGYFKTYEVKCQSSVPKGDGLPRQNQRLDRIQKIHSFVGQIQQRCSLDEQEKLDCLIESLRIIKKVGHNMKSNEIETRSKRMSGGGQEKAVQQVEMKVITDLSQLILLKLTPAKRTQNSIICFLSTVIEDLCEFHPDDEQQEKVKGKRGNKKQLKDRVNIQIRLASGVKINLIWFLVFKVTQKYLENFEDFSSEEKSQQSDITPSQIFQKHVNSHIKDIIRRVVLERFAEINLWKDLLKAITLNIDQLELPIVPFFLKNVHALLEEQFKIYFKVGLERNQFQKIQAKELYSLEHISILLELLPKSGHQMIDYQSSVLQAQVTGVCSYCGVKKVNSLDRSLYQKILFSFSDKQTLTLTVCEECCHSLQTEPTKNASLMVFLPLLLDWFQKNFERSRMEADQTCLRGLMAYHEDNPGKKIQKGRKLLVGQRIPQKISVSDALSEDAIHQLYYRVLVAHSNISMGAILVSLFQMVLIFWNLFQEEKMRERSIKMLNKSSIIGFLFESDHPPSLQALRTKIITSLFNRLKDCSSGVSLASLQFLAQLFVHGHIPVQERQNFFSSIFEAAREKNQPEYICKCVEIVEKPMLALRTVGGMEEMDRSLLEVRVLMRGFNFIRKVIESCRKEGKQSEVEDYAMAKLFNRILDRASVLWGLESPKALRERVDQQFLKQFKQSGVSLLNQQQLLEYPDNLLLGLLCSVKLSVPLLRSVSLLYSKTIIGLLSILEEPWCGEQMGNNIRDNLILLMEMVFQDVTSLKEEVFFPKKREAKGIRSSKIAEPISEYINSSAFLELLLTSAGRKGTADHPDLSFPCPSKLYILDRWLHFNNMNQLLCRHTEVIKYINIWEKVKKKAVSKSLDPVVLSTAQQLKLHTFSEEILEATKYSNPDQIELQGSLLVNIKSFLGRVDDLRGRIIFVYQKFCVKFYQEFLEELLQHTATQEMEQLISKFMALSRCLHVTTVLVVKLEEYMAFNHAIEGFYQNQIADMVEGNQFRTTCSVSKPSTEVLLSSERFKKMYSLVLSSLLACPSSVKKNREILLEVKKMLLLLRYYWQTNPKSIFSDNNIFAVLDAIDEQAQEGFLLTKSMYQLFESLLPSQNLEMLSFIRDQFSRRFPSLIKLYGGKDAEFVESCFSIVYDLLKCGMEGLYQYNKYIFYGLLHPSPKVNQIAKTVIRQIYAKEGSEKVLFINLMDSLELVYELLFKEAGSGAFGQIQLSKQQEQNVGILSEVTRKKGQVYLPKDKKEIRIKTTFIKKVGDILGADVNLLKSRPNILSLILELARNQKVLDFIQLSEILFCLHKMSTTHLLLLEDELEIMKNNVDLPTFATDFSLQTQMVVAYRDLVSCIAYFCNYRQVSQQIKTYQQNFQQSASPYTQLTEQVPRTPVEPDDSAGAKLVKIEQDIDTFQDLIEGQCEVAPSRRGDKQSSSFEDSGSSSMTVLTKAKGSKKEGNRVRNRKRTNKHSESTNKVAFKGLDPPSVQAESIKGRLRSRGQQRVGRACSEC